MNWSKAIITGVVGGVVLWLYDFLMHGVIMVNAYTGNTLFIQGEGSPVPFLVYEVFLGIGGALLFLKTRSSWGDGPKAGLTFGLFVGIIAFFSNFINPLIFNGFPYYLAWCWGGINLIGWMLFGIVAAMMNKQTA